MLKILSALFVLYAGVCEGACDGKCEVPVTHYKELGCTAVFKNEGDCCPSHFDCNNFNARSVGKCYYDGKAYNVGDRIENELVAGNCLASCFCSEEGKFICAHIDCPEFFGVNPLKPGCYRSYEHKSCCSIGTKCPPFTGLGECKVNGKIYHEGQRFEAPDAPNLSCICQKNFAGKFEEPFCTPVNCKIEILGSKDFKNNCAPVYYGKKGVCPIQWQCEENVLSIQVAKENKGNDKKCKFNDKELNVGDKVILKKPYKGTPDVDCECIIPPLVTCIQRPHES